MSQRSLSSVIMHSIPHLCSGGGSVAVLSACVDPDGMVDCKVSISTEEDSIVCYFGIPLDFLTNRPHDDGEGDEWQDEATGKVDNFQNLCNVYRDSMDQLAKYIDDYRCTGDRTFMSAFHSHINRVSTAFWAWDSTVKDGDTDNLPTKVSDFLASVEDSRSFIDIIKNLMKKGENHVEFDYSEEDR